MCLSVPLSPPVRALRVEFGFLGDPVPNLTWGECTRSDRHPSNLPRGRGRVLPAVRANAGSWESGFLTSLENEAFPSRILRLLLRCLLVKSAAVS